MVVTRGEGGVRNREILVWGTKLQVCRMSKSRHLKYSMLAIINNTVLYTENLLRK